MQKTREIAIFGGSFDPPTIVHQMVIRTLLEMPGFDEVWVMPSGERRDKPDTTSVAERLAMLAIMKGQMFPDDDRLHISQFEIDLQQPTETYRTAAALANFYPDARFWFVFGADSIETMHTWHQGDWLRDHLPMLVVPRAGYVMPPTSDHIRELDDLSVFERGISSTMVRQRVALGGEIDDLTCPRVAEYIEAEELYRLPEYQLASAASR